MSSNPQVTIDIHANTDALRNELNSMSNQTPNNPPQNPPVNTPSTPTPPERELQFNNGRYEFMNKSGGTQPTTLNDRMTQDIRREMMSRGVMFVPGSTNYNQLMSAVVNQRKSTALQEIDDTRVERITTTQQEYENKRKVEFDKLEDERKQKLSTAKSDIAVEAINERFNKRKKELEDRLLIGEGKEYAKINQETDEQRAKVEQDLTKAANEILQEMRQGNKNSYIGGLREKHREAIWRRDNAETEAEARAASAEAAEIQKQISRGSSPRNYLGGLRTAASLFGTGVGAVSTFVDMQRQNTFGKIATINAAANGDIFGAMEQDIERGRNQATLTGSLIGMIAGGVLGGLLTPFTGGASLAMGIGLGSSIGAGVGGIGARTYYNATNIEDETQAKLGQLWASNERRIQQFNQLALVTKGSFDLGDLENARIGWINDLQADTSNYYAGVAPAQLGYSAAQFSEIMANRIKQRGFISDDDKETSDLIKHYAKQVALERAYNMSEGSLAQYSIYDRYDSAGGNKNNANDDMGNLVASLNDKGVRGMSNGQTLRANEFLNYQTQLMEMQKGWMNAPNANYATKLLLAAQNAFGNNLDSRAITEIGQVENTVTHPKEDYSKALLYDVIQDVMPETKGNLLAIRQAQYSDDPNVRMKIQQAMAKRIQEVYGGLDTTSGYLAASHYYGIEDPERLRKIIGQYENGIQNIKVLKGNSRKDAIDATKGYTPRVSYEMLKYQDQTILDINDKLSNISDILEGLPLKFSNKIDELLKDLRNN